MNPYNRPHIVNANIWDKHMADAHSLTHPNQDPNHFDLLHSQMNPESISMVFASDGFSNFSAGAIANCNLKYPPPRTKSAKKKAYQDCLVAEQKKIDVKKASGSGGVLGIGTGRRKACKDSGLTGAEKRECARELKARGWKKGQPIPADMAGITINDVVQVEKEPINTPKDAPMPSDSKVDESATDENKVMKFISGMSMTEKMLIASGVIIGVTLLIYGLSGKSQSQPLVRQ
jgi:hypothetical protein